MNIRLKRIIGVTLGLLLVSIMCTGGAWAYLGNGSSDNSVSNGVFDLKVGNGAQPEAFNFPNAAPGDTGQYVYHLENDGNAAGNLIVSILNVINTAGTIGQFAYGSGELGRSIEMAFYFDLDNSGGWSPGDIGLSTDRGIYRYQPTLQYNTLDSYNQAEWNTVTLMAAGEKANLVALRKIPAKVGNEIQGDSVSFDISFTLIQTY